jgi:PAS domain S-box-containing protein
MIALFLLFGIIPLGMLTLISFFFFIEGQKQGFGEVQKEIAGRVSLGISTYLETTMGDVQLFAERLNPQEQSPFVLRTLAYHLLDLRPEYNLMTVADLSGNEICKVSRYYTFREKELNNVSRRGSFKTALEGRVHLSPITISELSGLPNIHVTVPIFNLKKAVTGTLEVGIAIDKMWYLISQHRIGKNRYAYVVDTKGSLIAYQEISSILSKRKLDGILGVRRFLEGRYGVFEYRGLGQEPVIGANALIPLTGWGVVVEEPKKTAMANLYTLSIIALGIFAVTGLLAILFGIRFSFRKIIDPIRQLQEEANNIAKGDFNRRIPVRGKDELSQLAESFNSMLCDLQNTTVSMDLLVQEVDFRKQAEKALQQERDQAQQYLDIAGVLLFAFNDQGRITLVNKKGCELLGYEEQELIGADWFETSLPVPLRKKAKKIFERYLAGETDRFNHQASAIITKSGEERIFSFRNAAIRDAHGKIIGLLSSGDDITERKRLEKKLSNSARLLKAIIESTADGILAVDVAGNVVGANGRFCELWRIPKDLMEQKNDAKLLDHVLEQLQDPEFFIGKVNTLYASMDEDFDILYFKDGRVFERFSRPLIQDERLAGRVWCFRDVTRQKRAEESLKATLHEKETLLREIHHRVKNNIQVISSLLSLQADSLTDEATRRALTDSQQRIVAMAMIHEILYSGKTLSAINLAIYLENLVFHLQGVYGRQGDIAVQLAIDPVEVGMDEAIPCGLIVTELVTNAMKYAFPSQENGEIRISVTRASGHLTEMTVSDNGVGLPGVMDPGTEKTLGMRLVIGLVEDQLEGTWNVERNEGTRWVIRWPAPEGWVKGED